MLLDLERGKDYHPSIVAVGTATTFTSTPQPQYALPHAESQSLGIIEHNRQFMNIVSPSLTQHTQCS